MSEDIDLALPPPAGWRIKSGTAIFVLSIIGPLAGLPVVAGLGLSATMTATISGVLLVGAEVLGILAVAVMGKPGFAYIKSLVFGFIKQHGPPREVRRSRYYIGLVMFCLPILFAWVSIYTADYIPGFTQDPLPYAIGGDLLLLASLFVLGGNFWDKIRSLFVHDAVVQFPESSAQT
jgi:hypothetical protein